MPSTIETTPIARMRAGTSTAAAPTRQKMSARVRKEDVRCVFPTLPEMACTFVVAPSPGALLGVQLEVAVAIGTRGPTFASAQRQLPQKGDWIDRRI